MNRTFQDKPIYLDYNATTPICLEAYSAMQGLGCSPLNPSSLHHYGRKARQIIEQARTNIKRHLGVPNDYLVIFTSSGTEANNLCVEGLPKHFPIISSTEHVSVIKPSTYHKLGSQHIAVHNDGLLDIEDLKHLCESMASKSQKFMVSVMLANNETGVLQPIHKIAEIVHYYGGIIHTDISQAVAKIPVSLSALGVDAATISSHKCYGPLGAAALIYRPGISIEPQINGGGQQFGKRAGTENIPAIVGMATAIDQVETFLSEMPRVTILRDYLESGITSIFPEVIIAGREAPRLPNTSCMIFPGISSQAMLAQLDLAGFAASSGSACSSGKVESSHVLIAMGYDEGLASSAVRFSLGRDNSVEQIDQLISAIEEIYTKVIEAEGVLTA